MKKELIAAPAPYMVQLDGFRFLAVSLVMVAHWIAIGDRCLLLNRLTGSSGVNLFFVLSGFLISGILMTNKDSMEGAWQFLKQFYVRRFLRIFPLYYLVIFIGVVFIIPGAKDYFFWHIAYTSNYKIALNSGNAAQYTHLWSLAVEEQFYIVFPFLILITPKRHYLKLFYTLGLLAIVCRITPYLILNDENKSFWVSYAFTPCCFDSFAIGAILAFYFNYDKIKLHKLLQYKSIYFTSLLLFIVCTYFNFFIPTRTLYSFFCFWVIGTAALGKFKGATKGILENRAIIYLGKITYGLYVYHFFMPWLFYNLGIPEHSYSPLLYFAATVLIASTSWYLFEDPINKLKKFFEYKQYPKGETAENKLDKRLRISLIFNSLFVIGAVIVLVKKSDVILVKFSNPKPIHPNIIVYGDSRVSMGDWGTGLQRQDVYNSAIGGAATGTLLDSLEARVIKLHPRVCILQCGVNDVRMQVNKDTTIKNYNAIIDALRRKKIIVVTSSVIPVTKDPFQYAVPDEVINNKVDTLNMMLKELALAKGVEFMDLNKNLAENKRFKLQYTLDGVHVNPAGFAVWFKDVKAVLYKYRL